MKQMTKKILSCALAGLMVLSIASCSKKDRDRDDEEEEESLIETEEPAVSVPGTTEATTETTPAPAIWGEDNDLTFGVGELTAISYCYSVLDGEEIEGSGVEENVLYSIPSVDASEPDEDGYVTYTIDYTISGSYDPIIAFDVSDHTDSWSSNPQEYNVIDYYTGTILCDWENSYNDKGEEIAVKIDNGEEEITVYVSAAFDMEVISNTSSKADNDHWAWSVEYICYMTITLRAPESYDGMLLEINTAGWTEADHIEHIDDDEDDGAVEGDLFEDDLSTLRFTRVSDLIIEG